MPIKILIVDDQAIVRSGLRMIIESDPELVVVAEAEDGAQALVRVAEFSPHVVLMDLTMPGVDGVESTRQLVQLEDAPRVIVISSHSTDAEVIAALSAGACGFLLKDLRPEELFAAIRAAASGSSVFTPAVLRSLVGQAVQRTPIRVNAVNEKIAKLSESERRVLALIGLGKTNAQISTDLTISESSVKTYVSRGLSKLGLENRTQAAIVAYETGLSARIETELTRRQESRQE
ncbi:response regulator [Streptomyces pathocidini]|uniref:Response regulator n=1 Tax=Streptomyces pathocidini TaxID=1650571 RepID=A0ABW7UXJ7_9ACTN|nr:response regulator transcription factor [Streptomyces pathocidini]